jgi:cobalt-zinc-cadmium efflux system membrane fusion protein
MKIRFASDAATQKAGVKTSVTGQGTVSDRIEVFAEVMFDQNKIAHIALPVDGILQKVNADLGDRVSADEVLARVTSVEISKAIGDYRRAIAQDRLKEQTIERERKLRKENISSERDLQEAIAAHQAADAEVLQTRHQLLALGLSSSQVSELEKDKTTSTALEVRAPFAGEVVDRAAVQGALVETGTPLFKIVDRSKMWAMLKVPAGKIDQVRLGQRVEIRLDADPGQIFEGRVTWISAEIDENTRMAKVRAEISNPEKRLRSGVFARGSIILTVTEDAVVIPQSSLQQIDDQYLAFVKLEEDLYEARPVTLGAKQGDDRQILEGLIPGETIVVKNSFVMKSQLLLSRLGAGCVDD